MKIFCDLLVWSCNLEDVQLKSNLTNIIVDPCDHEVAHGLRRCGVDKVGAVLHGVSAAHVLKVAAHSKPRGTRALWTPTLGKTVLGCVAGAVVVLLGQAHLILEPGTSEVDKGAKK